MWSPQFNLFTVDVAYRSFFGQQIGIHLCNSVYACDFVHKYCEQGEKVTKYRRWKKGLWIYRNK